MGSGRRYKSNDCWNDWKGERVNQHLVSLDALAIRINQQQEQIEQAWGMTLELAKQAGEMLIEAKRLAGHGNWLPWLETNCRVSASMAEKYMKIAKGWDTLAAGNPEHVPNLSIRDAVKLLAKPRSSKVETPPTIDAEFSEVVAEPPPSKDPMSALVDQLEAEFLRIPFKEREPAVEQALERLFSFKDVYCAPTTTLTRLRETFPGVAYRDLRKELAGYIGQWQYARIQRNRHGQECVRTEWAEEFVQAQKANGWKAGEPLQPWFNLIVKTTKGKSPKLPSLPPL